MNERTQLKRQGLSQHSTQCLDTGRELAWEQPILIGTGPHASIIQRFNAAHTVGDPPQTCWLNVSRSRSEKDRNLADETSRFGRIGLRQVSEFLGSTSFYIWEKPARSGEPMSPQNGTDRVGGSNLRSWHSSNWITPAQPAS